MTDTLDEAIQALAARGELSHLSVIASGGGFAASYSPCSTWGNGHGFDPDPVQAIHKAIAAAPKGKTQRRAHPPAPGIGADARTLPVEPRPAKAPVQADAPPRREIDPSAPNLNDLFTKEDE